MCPRRQNNHRYVLIKEIHDDTADIAPEWVKNTSQCFYRAMLSIRGTNHGPVSVRPSVCLSVTSWSSTKTAKGRVTQTTPHDSPGTLVF